MAKINKKTSDESEVAKKFKQNPGLYIGSVVILILVVIVFLFGDFMGRRSNNWDNTFGYYDKMPIMWAQDNVFHNFQRNAIQYYQSQGYDMSNQWIAAQIWRQAYEAAVVHVAVLKIMNRSNYFVPVKTVDKKVASLPDFQENGRFSAAKYNQMSKTAQLALWRNTQEDLIKGLYFDDFFEGLLINNAEAEFIGNLASPERSFDMVSFNIDNYPESEYFAYAEANAHLFDSIHLSKITITASEREAKKVLEQINSGTITFEDAARAHSQDSFADRGGDMGSRLYFDLENEIPSSEDKEAVVKLGKGEMSSVIKIEDSSSANSWVIYRAEDDIKKADFNDEMVMERVRSYLLNFERGRMEDWTIELANEFVNSVKEINFATAARIKSLEVNSFGPFPINYGGIELFSGLQSNPIPGFSEQDITGLSNNENFWKIAFSTDLNTPSTPFVHNNTVLVLCPKEEIDLRETKAKDAASSYLSYWLNSITEQSIQHYFLNNPRMDDRFWSVYQP